MFSSSVFCIVFWTSHMAAYDMSIDWSSKVYICITAIYTTSLNTVHVLTVEWCIFLYSASLLFMSCITSLLSGYK